MIDQSNVNLLDIIPTALKKVASTNGGEYAGPCPMCGGKDRFRVQPNNKPNPRWMCRQCNPRGGDPIAFLMAYSNIDFKTACDELRITLQKLPANTHGYRQPVPQSLSYSKEKTTGADLPRWQERAKAFIAYAEGQMWIKENPVRNYLQKRGFEVDTLAHYRVGYNPNDLNDNWGLDKNVWLPAGIVIPYEFGDFSTISKIRIRRLHWKEGDNIGKYIPPAGVKNTAFVTRTLMKGDYVLICEGELDAMIFKQFVTHPKFVGFATGGTHGAKLLQNLAMLALAERVFVAFDCDDSGETASRYWLDALPNATRLKPTAHDINDMVLAGHSLNEWIRKAL